MYTLGLHFEKNILKVALLRREKKQLTVELLRTLPSDVKPLYTLSSLLSGKKAWITTGLEAWEVLLRQVTLKLIQQKALLKALPFQIEALIPFPSEEGIFIPFFQKKDKDSTEVTLFTAKRQHVEKHLEDLKELEIIPDQVSCNSSALHRFACFFFPEHQDLFLFHLGEEKSSYLSIQKGQLVLSQTLPIGKRLFIEENMAVSSQIEKELQRMAAFLSQKFLTRHFLLTGDLEERSETFIKTALGSSFSFLTLSDEKEHSFSTLQSHAIAIGLSLEEEKGVQFRQGPYEAPQKMKSKKRALLAYLATCFALTLTLWIGTTHFIKQKKADLFQELQKVYEGGSKENLSEALDTWEGTLQKSKRDPSSYALTLPNVSDVLAWISSLPQLESIEIKRVRYFLTKFPKIGSEQDPYEAKVELEFTTPSPRLAREFHDALLAGNELVNAKLPISWEASQENYSTSFHLNRKG